MAGRRTWVFWARGALLSAVCGHWIANLLFDSREFTRAGLEYTWRANISILIQTLVVLIVVALLGPLSKHRRAQSLIRPARSTLAPSVGLLIASQLVLFLVLEVSERVVQNEPFADGLLASGFFLELLLAIGSALLLACLGSAAVRAIRSLGRRRATTTNQGRLDQMPRRATPAQTLIVVGDVRAPPLVPA